MMRSPIFIVGCPRSGTSLLRNLLRSHPNLTFPRESHFIPTFYRAYGDPQNDRDALDLAKRILSLYWIKRWDFPISADQFVGCRSFRGMVCALFEAWARQDGKPRWGDKTPQYVTEIPTLLELFPEAQIIHIYRDGRDVALSWLRSKLEPGNLFTAATLWRSWVMTGRRAAAGLQGDSYLEVQYEQLLADPPRMMQTVCTFLHEPFCDDVLRINSLPSSPRIRELTVSTAQVVSTNVEKWKVQLSEDDCGLFASVAGDLLEKLGYEAAGHARAVSPMERLMWRCHHALVRSGHRLRRAADPAYVRTAWEWHRAGARRRAR